MANDFAYKVVSEVSVRALEMEVHILIQQGWRLVGGIATLPPHEGHSAMFYQAMTKGGKSA